MKLKLFIITLIALSLAVTGLLGGCGGSKNKDTRDKTISIEVDKGEKTKYTDWGTAGGKKAYAGYGYDNKLIWLVLSRKIDNDSVSTDTLYVLSGVAEGNDQKIFCKDVVDKYYVDFTPTSDDDSIAELNGPHSDSEGDMYYYTTSYDETGEAKISIETENGKKTWFKVIVVDSRNKIPEFKSTSAS